MAVLLDAWGIGKRVCLNIKHKMEIASGVYGVGGPGFMPSIRDYTIPPMISDDQEYIDLIPFLLFDEVILDKSTFRFATQTKSLPGGTREVFEYLDDKEIIKKIDYKKELEGREIEIIRKTKTKIHDETIYPIVIESAKSWKTYLLNLKHNNKISNYVADTADAIDEYIMAFQKRGNIDQETLNLLEYQMWDVQCLKTLHERLKCPVYFWKDYGTLFNHGYLKEPAPELVREINTFSKLWDLYVPLSISTRPDLFVKLREDSRLIELRKFIKEISDSDTDIDESFLEDIRDDIANIDDGAVKYTRLSGFLFLALSPYYPQLSVAGILAAEAMAEIIKHRSKNKFKWHYFLQNSHKLFHKNTLKLKRMKRLP
jgi:hypothetical protein